MLCPIHVGVDGGGLRAGPVLDGMFGNFDIILDHFLSISRAV